MESAIHSIAHGKTPKILDEIISGLKLMRETNKYPDGVTIQDLRKEMLPELPYHTIYTRLEHLVKSGDIEKTSGDNKAEGNKYLYKGSGIPAPITPQQRQAPAGERARGIKCDCGALVGLRAKDGLRIVTCNDCQVRYVIEGDWVSQLGTPRKAVIWRTDG